MKKYFLGCTAIVLAIAFSSFTKPPITPNFKLKTTVNFNASSQVNQLASWEFTTSATCTVASQVACVLEVSSVYFHEAPNGDLILNDAAYAARPVGTNPVTEKESGDLEMKLTEAKYTASSIDSYYIVPAGTGGSVTTAIDVNNRQR